MLPSFQAALVSVKWTLSSLCLVPVNLVSSQILESCLSALFI